MGLLQNLYEKRKSLAIQLGLIGLILLLISLLANEIMPHQLTGIWYVLNIIIELFGRIGEVFFIAGFIAFIVEQHPIAETVKGVSATVINEIISTYFKKNDFSSFINSCIRSLDKFESIDPEIYSMYEKHGLLELLDEPRRFKQVIILKIPEEKNHVESKSNKISVEESYSYTVQNTAKKSGECKCINRDGTVAFCDNLFPNNIKKKHDEIIEYINKNCIMNFECSTALPKEDLNSITKSFLTYNSLPIEHIYIQRDDFNKKNLRPKNCSKIKNRKPVLYGVYYIDQKNGKNVIKLNYYFYIKIPPGGVMNLSYTIKSTFDDFELFTYTFLSWTKGVKFELQNFGDEYETKLEEVLKKGGSILPVKTDYMSKLEYEGWIMPHSSISVAWRRKVEAKNENVTTNIK